MEQHNITAVRMGVTQRVPKLGGNPRVTFYGHGQRTKHRGAWTSPRISVVALGSEDKPSSERQNLTLVLRMSIHLPEVSSSCLQNGSWPPGLLIRYYNRETHSPLQKG